MFRKINDSIEIWPWFSEEKGYVFNGTIVSGGGKKVLIDPALMDDSGYIELIKRGPFAAIYLTNKDHERMAYALRKHLHIPLGIHELDKPLLKEKPDFFFRDGETLMCGLKAVHLQNQKSPGECAFYIQDQGVMILGDALIGVPAGNLKMLPDAKYEDVKKAQAGLRRLFSLSFDMLLVGDGEPVLENAAAALETCFDNLK